MTDKQKIILSEIDSQRFNEVTADKHAATQVFDRAMANYHNALNSIGKTEMLLWQHLSETYNINFSDGEYEAQMDIMERRYVISAKN